MKAKRTQLITGILLVSLLWGNKLFTQTDTLQAYSWFVLADSLGRQAHYDRSTQYYRRAADIYRAEKVWNRYVRCLNQIGMNLTELAAYEAAAAVLDSALQIGQTFLNSPHMALAHTYICVGYLHHYRGEYQQALVAYDSCLNMRIKLHGPDHPEIASVATNLGTVYSSMGEEGKALNWHLRSLDIQEKHPEDTTLDKASTYNNLAVTIGTMGDLDRSLDYLLKSYELDQQNYGRDHPYVAMACNNIGYIYMRKGDFERAISFHRQSLAINEKRLGSKHPNLARNHSQIASCLLQEEKYEEALEEYAIALKIRQESEPTHYERFAIIYNNIGLAYLYQKKFDLAEANFREAIRLYEQVHGDIHPARGMSLSNLGLCFYEQKNFQRALEYYLQTEKIYQATYQAPHNELVRLYYHIGDNYRKLKQYELSKAYFNKALYSASSIPPDQQDRETPALDQMQASLELLDAISGKAHVLLEQSWSEQNPVPRLQEALQASQLAILIADTLRPEFRYRISQALLTANLNSLFETGIRASLSLHRLTGEQSYLESAFRFSEKSKYLLLMDARNATEARQFAGIPDSLLQREKQVEIEIAYYEKKLYTHKADPDAAASLIDWNQSLFQLKEDRIQLLNHLEQAYPVYFRLKHPPKSLDIKELQLEILEPDQSLLEYFVGEDSLYLFLLDQREMHAYQIPLNKSRLEELVDSLRQSIYGYHIFPYPDEELYQQSAMEYVHTAYALYQYLIHPVEDQLRSRIVLIPDGVLGYIPFSALLKELPTEAAEFREHAYFIRNHSISYAFSAQILQSYEHHLPKQESIEGVLAMAPGFPAQELITDSSVETYRNYYLGPLRYNQEEIASIAELLPGRTLYDQEASLQNFLSLAPSYSILHIATHGKANEQEADYSFLAFSPPNQSSSPELLYIRDLYNLQLQADLVVLSACETGTGELQRGEGIVSLAQGFAYAGVSSILTTLWSINDQQTAHWMRGFYRYLIKGNSIDQAVRQSHLTYLTTQDDFHAHPFFWAPYVPIGHMQAVQLSHEKWRIRLLFILILAIGGAGIWLGRKRFFFTQIRLKIISSSSSFRRGGSSYKLFLFSCTFYSTSSYSMRTG